MKQSVTVAICAILLMSILAAANYGESLVTIQEKNTRINNRTQTMVPREHIIDEYVWPVNFPQTGLENYGLPGKTVGTKNPYNGHGVPYWTGNF